MEGHHAKWNKSKKDKSHMIYMESDKNTGKLIYKTDRSIYIENKDPHA